ARNVFGKKGIVTSVGDQELSAWGKQGMLCNLGWRVKVECLAHRCELANASIPVVLQIDRCGTSGGMITWAFFGFEHDDAARRRKRGANSNPGDSSAYDGDID